MSVINGLYYGDDALNSYGALIVDVYADNWVGDSAPYTYTTPVPEEYKRKALFMYDLVPTGDVITENERIAFAYISSTKVKDGNIIFTANDRKPSTDIRVALRSSINEGVSSIKGILGTKDISQIGDGTLTGALRYLAENISDMVFELPTTGWKVTEDGYYYITIDQPEVLGVSNPIYGLYTDSKVPSQSETEQYQNIVSVSVDTGSITIYADKPITSPISIVVKGCALVDTSTSSTFIVINKEYTLETSGWVLNNETNEYEATIENPNITSNHIVDVMIRREYLEAAMDAGVSDVSESFDGGFKLFSEAVPANALVLDYIVFGTGSSSSHAYGMVGDVSELKTKNKTSIIDAINEVYEKAISGGGGGSSSGGGIPEELLGTSDISKFGDGTLTGAISYVADTMTDLFLINGITLTPEDWLLNSDTNKYEATIASERITENLVVNINFKDPNSLIITSAEVINSTESFNGGVRLFANNKPVGNIECDCVVMGVGGSTAVDMIGSISELETTSKNSVVAAINELSAKINAIQNGAPSLSAVTTTFNENGNTVETYADGSTITTTFNSDGSITQVAQYADGSTVTKTTTFNEDGSINEVIS